MRRRTFAGSLAGAIPLLPRLLRSPEGARAPVVTVRGPIDPAEMGPTLVHEHVLVDFAGAARVSRGRYDSEEVFRTVLPRLQDLRGRGCRTLVECTPAYLGRDPLLLRRLSEASGLNVLTNTGYYGAASDIAVPPHAWTESARQLADRWTAEFREGIEGTGIRPGFLKTGVDPGPLSVIDRKLVDAAALCHLETGLTLAVHTGDGRAAIEVLEVLADRGVDPEACVWVHAQNAVGDATRSWAAARGAWVELDGVSPTRLPFHVDAVVELHLRNQLDRVLVSQDAGWYHVGEPGGGTYRPHTFLFDAFVPALRARGLGDAEIRLLLEGNPARALAVRVRRSSPAPSPRTPAASG
jgi:phosphotriesterase-related protein